MARHTPHGTPHAPCTHNHTRSTDHKCAATQAERQGDRDRTPGRRGGACSCPSATDRHPSVGQCTCIKQHNRFSTTARLDTKQTVEFKDIRAEQPSQRAVALASRRQADISASLSCYRAQRTRLQSQQNTKGGNQGRNRAELKSRNSQHVRLAVPRERIDLQVKGPLDAQRSVLHKQSGLNQNRAAVERKRWFATTARASGAAFGGAQRCQRGSTERKRGAQLTIEEQPGLQTSKTRVSRRAGKDEVSSAATHPPLSQITSGSVAGERWLSQNQ